MTVGKKTVVTKPSKRVRSSNIGMNLLPTLNFPTVKIRGV